MSLFRSSALISAFTLASRLLGLVRDLLLAKILGASAITDAFFVALRLPNLLRQLFAEGAFNVAYVPLLSKNLKESQAAGEEFASSVFSMLMVIVVALPIIGMVFMDGLVFMLAPGFADDPALFDLAVSLSRISFPYFIFIVYVSFLGGTLNTLHRFAAAAAMPIILNLAFIGFLTLGLPYFEMPVYAPTWAIIAGGAGQALLLFFAMRRAPFKLRFKWAPKHKGIKQLLRRLGPSVMGVGAQQINTLVGTLLASLLAPASISYLFYADRLNQLPLALIGIAVGTALLPPLTVALTQAGRRASVLFEKALLGALLLGCAATAGLLVFHTELIQVLFERGAFTYTDAKAAGLALAAFSLGLPAYITLKITSVVFYAAEDTKTPFKTGLVSIATNLILNIALMPLLGFVGLALATTIAAWVNVSLQAILLRRRRLLTDLRKPFLVTGLIKVLISAVALTVAGLMWQHYTYLPADLLGRVGWLAGGHFN